MKAKTLVFVLGAVLAMATVIATAGCGGPRAVNVNDRAALATALNEFEMSAGAVSQALTGGSDGTVAAQLQNAQKDMTAKWGRAISAAKAMGWTGAGSADEAWKALTKAVDGLPANATVAQAQTAIGGPMDAVMAVEGEMWGVVQTTK